LAYLNTKSRFTKFFHIQKFNQILGLKNSFDGDKIFDSRIFFNEYSTYFLQNFNDIRSIFSLRCNKPEDHKQLISMIRSIYTKWSNVKIPSDKQGSGNKRYSFSHDEIFSNLIKRLKPKEYNQYKLEISKSWAKGENHFKNIEEYMIKAHADAKNWLHKQSWYYVNTKLYDGLDNDAILTMFNIDS
jgi:hypothetical protein